MTGDPTRRVLVVIPTYNEKDTLPTTVSKVRASVPDAHILVADDASPDGTGDVADSLAAADHQVHVLHREGKLGLGAAYLAGFRWGISRDFDVLVEMDADGSHPADRLPALLASLDEADVAIGSRWVPGGQVRNWPRSRQVLSRGANAYTRVALGIPVRDATAGFRAYRRTALEAIDLGSVTSQGYCFQIDLTRRALAAGLRVVEVPITFVERVAGSSKMSRSIIAEAMWRVAVWGTTDRTRRALRRPG